MHPTRLISIFHKKIFFAALAYGLLTIVPWGQLPRPDASLFLLFASDMLRLALALTLFIVPGASMYLLIRKNDTRPDEPLGLLPIGFALSIFLIAALGLIGRMVGWSFDIVRILFALVGFIILLLSSASKTAASISIPALTDALRRVVKNPALTLALTLAFLFTFHDYLFFLDDATYGAYVTNWQRSSHLGFQNLIHDPTTTEHIRFWLALFPMSQSLLVELSGVPALLLLSNYLELFLVPLALIALYWFVRFLGASQTASGFSALIQVALFAYIQGNQRPVGRWFFQSMAEDKVAAVFLLTPVLFFFVLNYLRQPSKRNLTLVLICGLGLMLTHPVILLMACVIALTISLCAWACGQADLRRIFSLALVFFLVMSPFIAIRAMDSAGHFGGPYNGAQAADTYEIELYVNYLNGIFYGINPGVLEFSDLPLQGPAHAAYQFMRAIPILLLLLGGALALLRLKQGPLYWYLASVNLLILFGLIPYTGWILGMFTSARLLYRLAWFAPLGISSALILLSLRAWTSGRIRHREARSSSRLIPLGLLLCFLIAAPMLVFSLLPRIPAYFQLLERNDQLSQVGNFIDRQSDAPVTVIALDYNDLQLIPTVSSRALLISFREEQDYNGFNNFMPLDEVRERIYASNTIRSLDPTIPADERCERIRKYEVEYILIRANQTGDYPALLEACGVTLSPGFATDDYVLFRVE